MKKAITEHFPKNILVFPCGSEIGLEIYRSLKNSTHFKLFGANSIDDHGQFVYENYTGNLPFINEPNFTKELNKLVNKLSIDAIYPAMDIVVHQLKSIEKEIDCRVIGSPVETTKLCLSKAATYERLTNIIPVPHVFKEINKIIEYPVFIKPDVGYGSRGTKKILNKENLIDHIKNNTTKMLTLEYLPGAEYTVDCFTDFNGNLLFVGGRERKRISHGISTQTSTIENNAIFETLARKINETLTLNGAWFFQVKENKNKELLLLEVASRIAGSSSLYRAKGINFSALSIFNAFKIPVSILQNDYRIVLDRALDNKYMLSISFQHVYVDLDDTLIVNQKINLDLILALFKFINEGKKVYLITKHESNLNQTLSDFRIKDLFDKIIHLKKQDLKYLYIKHEDAIFIDDSFAERKQVMDETGIPVFSPDMVETLI